MPCALQKSVTCFFLSAVLLACKYDHAQSKTLKVSTFNLESYGWQPLPTRKPGQRAEWPGTGGKLVSIDHKGRVLVGFTARENLGLATRQLPGLSFHILRFTREGNVDLSLVLPTKDYFTTGLYLGSDDKIFARANDSLQVLLERDETAKERMTWQSLVPCPRYCYVNQSFSRRTLILRTSEKPSDFSNLTYTILDASSSPPRIVQTCSRMANYAEKVTDRFAYWDGSEGRERFTRRFAFCDVGHPEEFSWTWGGGFFPLSDDAFLLLGTDKDHLGVVELVGSDGQVKFRQKMPKNDFPQYSIGFLATSDEGGDRFAFTVDTWRGGSRFFDFSGKLVARRVVVYDEAGQQLASVPVSTTYHRDFDFSLSPDGHRLAILDKNVLTVLDLD